MVKKFKVGVAGLGSVGAATVKLLQEESDLISLRTGCSIDVSLVSARDENKERDFSHNEVKWVNDPTHMAKDSQLDLVVEAIGGESGIAKAVIETALGAKKHVVTANKALIACHGLNLAKMAESAGVSLKFEAAVAGGIPIIKALNEGLSSNRVTSIYGILNGTCNYLLSNMHRSGREFNDLLEEAKQLGYAESDPTFDIDGTDTAHKLAILSSLAFSTRPSFSSIYTEGITNITPQDFEFADELGYRIKLLGIARMTEMGLEQRVHPCLVKMDAPIGYIEDVFNGVVIEGNHVGTAMFEGRGAGPGPTSSAVVADIIDIVLGRVSKPFGVPVKHLEEPIQSEFAHRKGAYYIRCSVLDQPGVFAEIATVLKENSVSMERVIQRGSNNGGGVQVVMTTHEAKEEEIELIIGSIDKSKVVLEPTRVIRIEPNIFGE